MAAQSPSASATWLCCTLARSQPSPPSEQGARGSAHGASGAASLEQAGLGLSCLYPQSCLSHLGAAAQLQRVFPARAHCCRGRGLPWSVAVREGNLKLCFLSCDLGSIGAISMLTSTQESRSGSSPTERMKMKDSRAPTEKPTVLPNHHLPKIKESIPATPLRVQQVRCGGRKMKGGELGVALPALGAGPRPCGGGGSFR